MKQEDMKVPYLYIKIRDMTEVQEAVVYTRLEELAVDTTKIAEKRNFRLVVLQKYSDPITAVYIDFQGIAEPLVSRKNRVILKLRKRQQKEPILYQEAMILDVNQVLDAVA